MTKRWSRYPCMHNKGFQDNGISSGHLCAGIWGFHGVSGICYMFNYLDYGYLAEMKNVCLLLIYSGKTRMVWYDVKHPCHEKVITILNNCWFLTLDNMFLFKLIFVINLFTKFDKNIFNVKMRLLLQFKCRNMINTDSYRSIYVQKSKLTRM